MKIQKSVIGIIVLALSTLFLIIGSTFQMPSELDKANELMYFQNIGKEISATTDDVGGNDESSTDESSNEERSSPNFRIPTLEGKSITDLDLSNFKPFSELEVKNSNDESLSSTFIDPSNDGTPSSDSGNSNFKSLSDLLEVESTTKTPSSSIDNQLVSRQFPNIESFGRDSNLGQNQFLPADSIIKGGIEKLGEALPPPINPDKPSKASCEAQGSIFNAATGLCESKPPLFDPSKPSKASCEAQGSIFNAATGRCQSIT